MDFLGDDIEGEIQLSVADAVRRMEMADPRDAWKHTGEPPPVDNPDAYGEMRPEHATPAPVELPPDLPLTIGEWRARQLMSRISCLETG